MYQIKLNKNQKSVTLKKVERSVKLIQKLSNIKLSQTGRRGLAGADSTVPGPAGPQGPPGEDAGGDKNFVQEFINSSEVTVTHNLNKYPAVTVTDSTGEEVIGQIEYQSINQLVATFIGSFTGRIVCN